MNKAIAHSVALLVLPTIAYNVSGGNHLIAFVVFVATLLLQEDKARV